MKLNWFCLKTGTLGFWGFVTWNKKELEGLGAKKKEHAKDIAEKRKVCSEECSGVENVKTTDVHIFLQHLITFGNFNSDIYIYATLPLISNPLTLPLRILQ